MNLLLSREIDFGYIAGSAADATKEAYHLFQLRSKVYVVAMETKQNRWC